MSPQVPDRAQVVIVGGNDYYGPDGIGELRGHPKSVGRTSKAKSAEDAAQLWDISLELTGADYSALEI